MSSLEKEMFKKSKMLPPLGSLKEDEVSLGYMKDVITLKKLCVPFLTLFFLEIVNG